MSAAKCELHFSLRETQRLVVLDRPLVPNGASAVGLRRMAESMTIAVCPQRRRLYGGSESFRLFQIGVPGALPGNNRLGSTAINPDRAGALHEKLARLFGHAALVDLARPEVPLVENERLD